MAAGFRSVLPHFGLSGSGAQGGFRTPLPGWNAGGGTGAQGGFRTPLPGWNAGGGIAQQGGYRGLLAYWSGGAGGLEPVVLAEEALGGPSDRAGRFRIQLEREDEEVVALIVAFMRCIDELG